MVGEEYASAEAFTWCYDRYQITVSQDGDSWNVVYQTESPLLGPRTIVHQARHRQPTHAAWDVLTRVSRATRDDEEGVRVAKHAARWMCAGHCGGAKPPA